MPKTWSGVRLTQNLDILLQRKLKWNAGRSGNNFPADAGFIRDKLYVRAEIMRKEIIYIYVHIYIYIYIYGHEQLHRKSCSIMTDDNMAQAHCMLDAWDYEHTLIICNNHCFSTAKMVALSRLNVTLYEHCLSCYNMSRFKWTICR